MRIVATFYSLDDDGEDMKLGTVTWDGKKAIPAPAKMPFLAEAAKEIAAQKDPAAAMKSLPAMYKSAYLRASVEGE